VPGVRFSCVIFGIELAFTLLDQFPPPSQSKHCKKKLGANQHLPVVGCLVVLSLLRMCSKSAVLHFLQAFGWAGAQFKVHFCRGHRLLRTLAALGQQTTGQEARLQHTIYRWRTQLTLELGMWTLEPGIRISRVAVKCL
jgi:hypothetical protein